MSGHHRHQSVEGGFEPLDSFVHLLAPRVKLVVMLAFVLSVVATPARAVWAFGLYAALVLVAAGMARLPLRTLGGRMAVEVPFVAFAIALPFLGQGPRHDVLGLSLSVAGSWAAWNILAKASLGVAVSVVLAWSTPVASILEGLERLRVPRALTAIAGFMVRYLDVIMGDLHRLQVARVSRGDDPRWAGQGKAIAATAGTLFVRCFERGERVHRAMLSRGFDGRYPTVVPSRRERWWPAIAWPLAAVAVATSAWLWGR
jgi:cobalt/nickel transport system permease protein